MKGGPEVCAAVNLGAIGQNHATGVVGTHEHAVAPAAPPATCRPAVRAAMRAVAVAITATRAIATTAMPEEPAACTGKGRFLGSEPQ